MDNLAELLGPLLSDPETMDKLAETARSMGLGDMLGQSGGKSESESEPEEKKPTHGMGDMLSSVTPEMLTMFSKLAPLLGGMNQEDDGTRLLKALRPYLGETRQHKLDEASQLLSIMRVIMSLKELND